MNIEEIVNSFEVIKDINDVMLYHILSFLKSDRITHGTTIFEELKRDNIIPFSFCGKDLYIESKFTFTDSKFVDTIILEWGQMELDYLSLKPINKSVILTDKFILNSDGSLIFNGNKKLSDYSWIEEYVQYALLQIYLPAN